MQKNKPTMFLMMMILAMLTWGGSWTSAKLIAASTAPEVLIFWRFLATFISFIPVVIVFKTPLQLDKKSLLHVILGAVFLVGYNKLFFQGLRTGMAGGGGVLVTTLNPIFTFVLMTILFKGRIHRKEALGLVLGFCGGMILLRVWSFDLEELLASGNLLFLMASMLWAMLSITTNKAPTASPLVFSFYVYGLSAFFDFFLAIPYGILEVVHAGWPFWLNILYLSVVVTTFGTTAYFFAAQRLGASRASSFIFLVPASAVFFSWLFLGEVPRTATLLGGLLAICAVYVINAKPKSQMIDAAAENTGDSASAV